ncbi:23S rRNA (guanosine(2251)-2'-O)-methyltransferase RlmB [Gammaproteobacteria bacterium]|nr:23S rRNA (guanosine(2251)-2'-O)-methyltransferase RlmB [Gammaproteobacteria bacterium]MDA9365238.1 23S rRNA (guanosine(2251)-2'-O)-methyltransferase RlmB [Gammaproteobacteria bacterium]MDA9371119.1 23S rRNA (guanosine(2251)-2'-O)-methyltransferase RlmB [Gammaproteobacteria bacterium]MDB9791059.1 23S rRNA (guanosine(2251)-2'-O)-methyltransferase RlmB [Gammaproteobacteria bacterium]MDB9896359.1 23S rRNA (guanosine(2251)-2'-O)-methyltransferase RlmB [Gammaproteobacteria bacterium]|tara:strand:- start:4911 stop:5633 length:723 start_codon:yes stop_codon:yes gene_type:complete
MENDNRLNYRTGFHVIEMILKLTPENIKQIFIPANRNDERVQKLILMAETASVSVERKKNLNQHPEAVLKKEESLDLSDLKKYEEGIQDKNPTFLVIDNVIDPRNLGACIRSAAASNIAGVIINKHHCSPLTPLVRQVSAGGTEAIKIFTVTNLINCVKHFEKLGYLILGTSEHAKSLHTDLDLNQPLLTIMGSEEEGMREKTIERCTAMCTLSKNQIINSLNVSVATGIILFEITRQKS